VLYKSNPSGLDNVRGTTLWKLTRRYRVPSRVALLRLPRVTLAYFRTRLYITEIGDYTGTGEVKQDEPGARLMARDVSACGNPVVRSSVSSYNMQRRIWYTFPTIVTTDTCLPNRHPSNHRQDLYTSFCCLKKIRFTSKILLQLWKQSA